MTKTNPIILFSTLQKMMRFLNNLHLHQNNKKNTDKIHSTTKIEYHTANGTTSMMTTTPITAQITPRNLLIKFFFLNLFTSFKIRGYYSIVLYFLFCYYYLNKKIV